MSPLKRSIDVKLKIFNLDGREVAVLLDKYQEAGNYETSFDARAFADGTYHYQLQGNEIVLTKKTTLIGTEPFNKQYNL